MTDGDESDAGDGNVGRDDPLYPNRGGRRGGRAVSRRRLLAGSATAGAALTAGCSGGSGGDGSGDGGGTATPTATATADSVAVDAVFVFNTGDGTVSVIDPATDSLVGTRHLDLTSSFPSNQYTPGLAKDPGDPLWCNVGRGVRALTAGGLRQVASQETGSGANWQEVTPDGAHLVVSARDGSHTQFRIDADPDSESFGEITGEIDRTGEGGRGDNDGPGPCDVTIHPDGEYAYVPDLYGDTLTVIDVEAFEIETQIAVDPVAADADGAAAPWMGTVAPDGDRLLVEHNEGAAGTESVWDTSDPAAPVELTRLTSEDDLGRRPLTSEVGPDSDTGYVFTPGSNDVTVVDIPGERVTRRIDLGGSAYAGTWDPAHAKLYVPVRSSDEVAVIDHGAGEVTARIDVGARPYGATAARVRPAVDGERSAMSSLAAMGVDVSPAETSYCIGECACGHRLDEA